MNSGNGQQPGSPPNDCRYFGVYTAIVEDVNDDEKEGRVKLSFPWYEPDTPTPQWCRVRQEYAGGGYGSFFVPEKGDEVLVAFVQGLMKEPVVLGGLYNGPDKPVTWRADDKDEKVIRTKAGHQISLVDTGGSEKITIVDKSTKNTITIDTTTNAITITADTSVTIEAKSDKLVLKGNTVEITATGQMTLKGQTININ